MISFGFLLIYCSRRILDLLVMGIFLETGALVFLYTLSWFHIIMLLIILEVFILNIFLVSSLLTVYTRLSGIRVFIFITLRVVEASIGVSLLTILVRAHGNDLVRIYWVSITNILKIFLRKLLSLTLSRRRTPGARSKLAF